MDWKLRRGQIKHLLYEQCLNGRINKELLREQFNDLNNVEPIKHGHWIVLHGVLAGDDIYGDMGECSNCGLHLRNWEWNYCPHCGAKMDGGERKENDVYCDRNLCAQNEYNGIECDECQKMRKDEAEE